LLHRSRSWTDWRQATRPGHVRIEHHKTRAMIWQPLDDPDVEAGERRFFPGIEDFLERLPRLGAPIVLLAPQRGPKHKDTGKRTRGSTASSMRDILCTRRAGWPSSAPM
jgi:hypothetical protein